jgi:hypothetical protein
VIPPFIYQSKEIEIEKKPHTHTQKVRAQHTATHAKLEALICSFNVSLAGSRVVFERWTMNNGDDTDGWPAKGTVQIPYIISAVQVRLAVVRIYLEYV